MVFRKNTDIPKTTGFILPENSSLSNHIPGFPLEVRAEPPLILRHSMVSAKHPQYNGAIPRKRGIIMTEKYESVTPSSPSAQSLALRPRKRPEHPLQRRLRRIRRNRFWLLLFLWVAAALPGLVLHTASGGASAEGLPFPPVLGLLFSLAPAMLVFLLCTAIPAPPVSYGISLGSTLFLFLFHALHLLCFRTYGTFLPIQTLTDCTGLLLSREVILASAPLLFLMALPSVLLLTLGRQLFSFRPLKHWKQHIPMSISCAAVHLAIALCLSPLGGAGDLTSHDPGQTTSPESMIQEPTPSTNSAISLSGVPLPTGDAAGANLLDLDFPVCPEEDCQDPLDLIHHYFSSRTASLKNEKTGLFRDCNLIQITVHGFSPETLTQEQAPTLWKMVHQGIHFTNFRSPEWGVSGIDRDYALLTGTIPCPGYRPEDNLNCHMPLTMVQQLIRRGYSAWGLDWGSSAEPRCRFLEALGYECSVFRELSLCDALDQEVGNWAEAMPFTAYCPLESSCGIGELELAMDLLIRRLSAMNALENTVILLVGTSPDSGEKQGSCILWKSGLNPETMDEPISILDLLPTLSNLFGLEFDSRLYMGRDVFSDDAPLVMLRDRSWITDRAMYDMTTGQVTPLTQDPVDDAYVEAICGEVHNRFTFSAGILEYDYWRILFE